MGPHQAELALDRMLELGVVRVAAGLVPDDLVDRLPLLAVLLRLLFLLLFLDRHQVVHGGKDVVVVVVQNLKLSQNKTYISAYSDTALKVKWYI